jgi:hypothetical protein
MIVPDEPKPKSDNEWLASFARETIESEANRPAAPESLGRWIVRPWANAGVFLIVASLAILAAATVLGVAIWVIESIVHLL